MGLPKSRAEQPKEEENPRIYKRGEVTGIILTSVLLLYALSVGDLPMIFFLMSILSFLFRKLTVLVGGNTGTILDNLLKGFGISLLIGTVFLMFV